MGEKVLIKFQKKFQMCSKSYEKKKQKTKNKNETGKIFYILIYMEIF